MDRLLSITLTVIPILMFGCSSSGPSGERTPEQTRERLVDLGRVFSDAGMEGCFVVLDDRSGEIVRHNPIRAAQRFVPASTFKIPNSMIALDTGVADSPDFALRYDASVSPRKDWWPATWTNDQTMRTAIRDSVVWYYQEIARRIGPDRMQHYVRQFDYGNHDISGPVDRFWLKGPLLISADEQVQFLRRFHHDQLGLKSRTTRLMREILVLRERPGYRLSGKSGTMDITPTRDLGWHVGYVEWSGRTCYYAMNMEGPRIFQDWPPSRRIPLILQLMRGCGFEIPEG